MTEWLHFHFSLACTGEGNGNPLQCSCLENPRDGGAWWAAVYGVAQSRTRLKWLSISSSSIKTRQWINMLFLIAKFETKHCNMYLILGYLWSKDCLKKHCIPVVKYMHSVSLSSHVQLATPHCSLPGSSVHGILQPRILEQVAIPFSRGSAGRFFIFWATREAPNICLVFIKLCYLTFFFLVFI